MGLSVVVLAAAAGLLAIEFVLTGVAAAAGMRVWRERMRTTVRVDLSRRAEWLVAAYCLVGLTLVVAGLWSRAALSAGGGLALLGSATVLVRQVQHHDPLPALLSYVVFTTCSALVLVLAATS